MDPAAEPQHVLVGQADQAGDDVVAVYRLTDGGSENVTAQARGTRPLPDGRYLVVAQPGDGTLWSIDLLTGEEVEIATQKLTAVIEPLIIVFLAVVVAAIILSIVLPLLQLQRVAA